MVVDYVVDNRDPMHITYMNGLKTYFVRAMKQRNGANDVDLVSGHIVAEMV